MTTSNPSDEIEQLKEINRQLLEENRYLRCKLGQQRRKKPLQKKPGKPGSLNQLPLFSMLS